MIAVYLLTILLSCTSSKISISTAKEVSQASEPPQSRDKYLWPFSSNSPWNMPIGSDAKYEPANIKSSPRLRVDEEYFFQLNADDPKRSVYAPNSWKKRCFGQKKSMKISLPVPDDLIIPDAKKGKTPNNASAFLMPDGKTLVQLEPLARCEPGGPIYGWRYFPDIDIYGDGIGGAHFGSGLSSIGGSIRRGELIGDQPIRHALKVNLWAKKYLYFDKELPGYRWPADRADKYASKQYRGKNLELVMGSLLAIPPSVSAESLGLQTHPAQKLFYALQNYGAYVVDDTAWNAHGIPMERGVTKEFRKEYGFGFQKSGSPFYQDIMKLFSSLHIIVNNDPNHIGGGGEPLMPLAPPISN